MVLFMYTYVSIKLRVHICKVAQFLKDSVQLEGFHKDITFLFTSLPLSHWSLIALMCTQYQII